MLDALFFRKIRWVILLAFMAIGSSAHSAPGDLYASESATGTILKFKPDGTKTTFVSGLDMPRGLAFDRMSNLFVSGGSDQFGDILKITPGGEVTVFASGFSGAGPLAFDGAGNLYVGEITNSDAGVITKVAPDGTKTPFGSFSGIESGYPLALAFSPVGNLYVTVGAPLNFDGGVVWFEPDGTGHTFAFTGGGGLAFNTGSDLFEADGNEILRYTLSPYAQSVFASGFKQAGHLAFDPEGNLFVTEAISTSSGSISKVSPDGTKTVFASGLGVIGSLAFEPILEKLRNISARGLVGTGDDVLIGGFIVGGNALANNAVVLRAIGPSLSKAGVSNALADPTLELHDPSGALIVSNDDWQDTQEEQITATGLAPTDPNEAAIYATLPAGNYTAVVRGAGDTTGTALVEIYSTL